MHLRSLWIEIRAVIDSAVSPNTFIQIPCTWGRVFVTMVTRCVTMVTRCVTMVTYRFTMVTHCVTMVTHCVRHCYTAGISAVELEGRLIRLSLSRIYDLAPDTMR